MIEGKKGAETESSSDDVVLLGREPNVILLPRNSGRFRF